MFGIFIAAILVFVGITVLELIAQPKSQTRR